jgi:hypothetical protein
MVIINTEIAGQAFGFMHCRRPGWLACADQLTCPGSMLDDGQDHFLIK